jgi:hypothetical protein
MTSPKTDLFDPVRAWIFANTDAMVVHGDTTELSIRVPVDGMGPHWLPNKPEVYATNIVIGSDPTLTYPELFVSQLRMCVEAERANYTQRYGEPPREVRLMILCEALSPYRDEDEEDGDAGS